MWVRALRLASAPIRKSVPLQFFVARLDTDWRVRRCPLQVEFFVDRAGYVPDPFVNQRVDPLFGLFLRRMRRNFYLDPWTPNKKLWPLRLAERTLIGIF